MYIHVRKPFLCCMATVLTVDGHAENGRDMIFAVLQPTKILIKEQNVSMVHVHIYYALLVVPHRKSRGPVNGTYLHLHKMSRCQSGRITLLQGGNQKLCIFHKHTVRLVCRYRPAKTC